MFWIVVIAWVAGIAISFANENRKLPTVVLLLGSGAIYLYFSMQSAIGIVALALLAIVILMANKFDAAQG